MPELTLTEDERESLRVAWRGPWGDGLVPSSPPRLVAAVERIVAAQAEAERDEADERNIYLARRVAEIWADKEAAEAERDALAQQIARVEMLRGELMELEAEARNEGTEGRMTYVRAVTRLTAALSPAEATEGERQSDYLLDGSPESVSIVRRARGLPPLTDPLAFEEPLQHALHDYLTPHPELGQETDERGCAPCFLIARAVAPAIAAHVREATEGGEGA